jgi:hypothetical protein
MPTEYGRGRKNIVRGSETPLLGDSRIELPGIGSSILCQSENIRRPPALNQREALPAIPARSVRLLPLPWTGKPGTTVRNAGSASGIPNYEVSKYGLRILCRTTDSDINYSSLWRRSCAWSSRSRWGTPTESPAGLNYSSGGSRTH